VAIPADRNVILKEAEIKVFMCRHKTNVEHEMYGDTGNNWVHWNSNEKFKEKFGSHTKKTFNRLTTKNSYTWNITIIQTVLQSEN
jgi:hypothetical protein